MPIINTLPFVSPKTFECPTAEVRLRGDLYRPVAPKWKERPRLSERGGRALVGKYLRIRWDWEPKYQRYLSNEPLPARELCRVVDFDPFFPWHLKLERDGKPTEWWNICVMRSYRICDAADLRGRRLPEAA
jgi:hypothetical protein